MFDPGVHQALGLQRSKLHEGPLVLCVACPAFAEQGYEILCELAAQINAAGRQAVVLDAHACEAPLHQASPGKRWGLLHALHDSSVVNVERGGSREDWLVLPAQQGIKTLQATARAGGARLAVSRLLAPFGSSVITLLYAPAQHIASLMGGMKATAVVPVVADPQSCLDAYGAVKVLYHAGLSPALLPGADKRSGYTESELLTRVMSNVGECAQRYLGHQVVAWPEQSWGHLALDQASSAAVNWGEHEPEEPVLGKFAVAGATYWS
ncbi:hypothetical protein [Hydrogenophaga sp. 5NK40-0174]|uniref:hypothetical protein n=1 Tax=Hydrogenophaga sp. 5NK40-0174 TaxID=3127649 RepID=UPI003109AE21